MKTRVYRAMTRGGILLFVIVLPLAVFLLHFDIPEDCRFRIVRSSWTVAACFLFLLWGAFGQGRKSYRYTAEPGGSFFEKARVRFAESIFTVLMLLAALLMAGALYDMVIALF